MICYQDEARFSKGQGFVGVLCRTVSYQARAKAWFAVNCPACKVKLLGRRVIALDGSERGTIDEVHPDRVLVRRADRSLLVVSFRSLDRNWEPDTEKEERAA